MSNLDASVSIFILTMTFEIGIERATITRCSSFKSLFVYISYVSVVSYQIECLEHTHM